MWSWESEPHWLIVTLVGEPGPFEHWTDGPSDFLRARIIHPNGCDPDSCAVSENDREMGARQSLAYSGTPVNKPGVYRVVAWGEAHYVWDCAAYEYDGGIFVVPSHLPVSEGVMF